MRRSNLLRALPRAYADAAREFAIEHSDDAVAILASLSADPGIGSALRRDAANDGSANGPRGYTDAQTLAAFARELEHVMGATYEEDFPDLALVNGDVIDLITEVPEGAESFTYYLYSAAATARLSTSMSSGSAPTATISGARVTGNVEYLENGYDVSMRELRGAAFIGLPVERMLQSACKRGHDELAQTIGLWGREDVGLPGLLKHPNITITRSPANGTGSSRSFEDKSVDLVIADVRTLIETPAIVSHYRRRTTHVFFDPETMTLLRTTRMGAGDGGYTLLKFLRETWPTVQFGELLELSASRSGGNLTTNSALAIVRDRQTLGLVLPMPFTQHPPEREGLKFKVACESSTGGVMAKEPITIHRMDDVGVS